MRSSRGILVSLSASLQASLDDEKAKNFSLLFKLERVIKVLTALKSELPGATRDLAVDPLRLISEWYHLPIHILIDMDGYELAYRRKRLAS